MAVDLFQRAAERGVARAQYNLGVMHANGQGVTADDAGALKWYQLAADQGHAKAQNNLGVLYSESDTVPQDKVAALMWFILAEAQGFEGAKRSRESASSGMTADQIAEAERRAREKLKDQNQ